MGLGALVVKFFLGGRWFSLVWVMVRARSVGGVAHPFVFYSFLKKKKRQTLWVCRRLV
jgi:hypothetical protein